MKNLNDLFILIQKNYPMFLTNDVSLVAIVGKIVDYVNGLIEREKILLEEFNKVKVDANTSITDLSAAITEFVKNENSNYLVFEQEILDSLVEYKNETDKEINAKSLEVDNALNNIDLTNEVATYFTSQLNTNYFDNLYTNTKKYVYSITYWGTTIPKSGLAYNPTTHKLYYNDTPIALLTTSLYMYLNKFYIAVEENGVLVLKEVGNTNG